MLLYIIKRIEKRRTDPFAVIPVERAIRNRVSIESHHQAEWILSPNEHINVQICSAQLNI